ncbi:MAG: hypothetical protein M1830_009661 [Pleopsidium flavum]|nr:MAG: hypothetical protein M1830_009661 [Pleopsidium flavum]
MDSPGNYPFNLNDEPTEFALSSDEDKMSADNDSMNHDEDDEDIDAMGAFSLKTKILQKTDISKTTATKTSKGKGKAAPAKAVKAGKTKASAVKAEKRKAVEVPSGVGLFGDDHKNPFNNILHPSKKSKKGIPLKKPLSKVEKDAKKNWETGYKEMLELRDAKVSEDNKKSLFTQTIVDKVCFAIQLTFPESARAQAHIPMEKQSQDSYQQSTRGRKPKLDGKATEEIVATLLASHRRDRRMAWQALKASVFYQSLGSLSDKQRLIQKLMAIYNERYRYVLWNDHNIQFGDIPAEQYYLGTDNFLKTDARIKDGIDVGRTFPIPTATAPAIAVLTTMTVAAPTAVPVAATAVATSSNANDNDDSPAGKDQNMLGHIIGLDDSDSGEKAVETETKQPVGDLLAGEKAVEAETKQPVGDLLAGEKAVEAETKQPVGDLLAGEKAVEAETKQPVGDLLAGEKAVEAETKQPVGDLLAGEKAVEAETKQPIGNLLAGEMDQLVDVVKKEPVEDIGSLSAEHSLDPVISGEDGENLPVNAEDKLI